MTVTRDDVDTTRTADDGPASALPARLVLVVTSGPDRGARLPLAPGRFVVGSSPLCDLRLRDSTVSRRHLELSVEDGAVLLRDLGSKNGSTYLGARFQDLRIGAGAQVTVGATALALRGEEGALPLHEADRFEGMVGGSAAMRRVYAEVERLAPSDVPVLVTGETGTGKELVAAALHARSRRAGGALVVCDLGAIAPSLIEGELFGHVRGAFTGADRDRAGVFEEADGGTIFLDEIGELATELQPRLLRILESSTVRRLGDGRARRFDARVVAATRRELDAEMAAERFRSDLYHRVAGAVVRLPPLRERLDDLPLLVETITGDLASRGGPRLQLPEGTMAALRAYTWPGNVRQLRNVLERGAALCPAGGELAPALLGLDDEDDAAPRAVAADPGVPFKRAKERLLVAWERDYVHALMARACGSPQKAAHIAGLDRAHVYRLLKKHGVRAP